MRNFLFVFGLLVVLNQTQALGQIDSRKVKYLKKVETYKRLRNTGFIMAGIGVGSAVVGITMLNQEEKNYNKTYQYDEDRIRTGIFCVLLGVPLTIAGSIIGPIGAVKVGKYRKKLENLAINPTFSPQQQGLSLRYNF